MKRQKVPIARVAIVLVILILSSCSEHNGMGPEQNYIKADLQQSEDNHVQDPLVGQNVKDYGYTDVGWVDPCDKDTEIYRDVGWVVESGYSAVDSGNSLDPKFSKAYILQDSIKSVKKAGGAGYER